MKKLAILSLSVFVTLFSACSNDEKEQGTPELSVNAYISSQKQDTRAEKSAWAEGDLLGVFVCNGTLDTPYLGNASRYFNTAFRHNGKAFVGSEVYLNEELAEVYAYFPYSAAATNGKAIPVESTTQTDYLYGHSPTQANISQRNVNLEMKHALSQVVFRLKRSASYNEGPCSISAVTIENNDANNIFKTTGTLDLSTGIVTGTSTDGVLSMIPGSKVDLTESYQNISSICLPVNSTPSKNIKVIFTIDERQFRYEFAAGTSWQPATRNIYTLTVGNSGLEIGGGDGDGDGNDDGIIIEPWGDGDNTDISLVPIL
ncbi:fimbrillin family protein [Bacteroides sp. 51]|uniref:fimbrillin family protein n=1 Tax=Bacteroides sp. 51 TaxID=2302938 RepID=UPI0013CF4ADD|nr:fimbrillin family protein [Bacteroides sp. 51]NDV83431.1 fimbrillin family protein [Bacteroides sp. 51]